MADILQAQYKSVFTKPLENYDYNHIDYNCEDMGEVIFNEKNIMKQIVRLKGDTSTGPDGIVTKCFKYGGQYIVDAWVDIYNQMKEEEYAPKCKREEWISPV